MTAYLVFSPWKHLVTALSGLYHRSLQTNCRRKVKLRKTDTKSLYCTDNQQAMKATLQEPAHPFATFFPPSSGSELAAPVLVTDRLYQHT